MSNVRSSLRAPVSPLPPPVQEPPCATCAAAAPKTFDQFVKEQIGALPTDISEAGKQSAVRRKDLHQRLVKEQGYGLYYGTEGKWRPRTDAPDLKHPMSGSNCLAWALEVTGDAFKAAGQEAEWKKIQAVVKKDPRGTTLARELQARGWTAVYWNPDVEHPVDGGAWKLNAKKAAKNGGYYERYGGPKRIDDAVVNYTPNPLKKTIEDDASYARLEKVPFYFGLAEGGMHTFVGGNGNVSEFHWDRPGTDPDAIEVTRLDTWYDDSDVASGGRRYQYAEGVLMIPPGEWAKTKGP